VLVSFCSFNRQLCNEYTFPLAYLAACTQTWLRLFHRIFDAQLCNECVYCYLTNVCCVTNILWWRKSQFWGWCWFVQMLIVELKVTGTSIKFVEILAVAIISSPISHVWVHEEGNVSCEDGADLSRLQMFIEALNMANGAQYSYVEVIYSSISFFLPFSFFFCHFSLLCATQRIHMRDIPNWYSRYESINMCHHSFTRKFGVGVCMCDTVTFKYMWYASFACVKTQVFREKHVQAVRRHLHMGASDWYPN